MEVKITKKEQAVLNVILSIVFIIVGIAFFIEGIPSKTITIEHTPTGINAHLHRTSTSPPFKSIDNTVKNIKKAILEKKSRYHSGREMTFYSVVLETYKGEKVYVTESSLVPFSQQELRDQINNSIQNGTPFTKTFRESFMFFFGLFLIVFSTFMLFWEKRKREKNRNQEIENSEL